MGKGYSIRKKIQRKNGRDYISWELDLGRIGGRRRRKYFSTRIAAEAERDKRRDSEARVSEVAVDLDQRSSLDAAAGIAILRGRATLEQASQYYISKNFGHGSGQTVGDLISDYIDGKIAANRRPPTIAELRSVLGRFSQAVGNVPISSIAPIDLTKWLDEQGHSGAVRKKHRIVVGGLFKYAIKLQLMDRNPIDAIPVPFIERAEIRIFEPGDVETLLTVAAELWPEMVPYFAIGLFAGLRPDNEIRNLRWSNIQLKTGIIRVEPATAKRRRQRLVDIRENLADWLRPHSARDGKIFFSRRHFCAIREAAAIAWAPDIMRHTYASYHLASTQNANATALQLGHSSTELLFNHYREIVSKKDAKRFWKITPRERGAIVDFESKKAG